MGVSRLVFDGGGKEPPSRCGRLTRGDGGGAVRISRCRCDSGDWSGSREEDDGIVEGRFYQYDANSDDDNCGGDDEDVDVDIDEGRSHSVDLHPPPKPPNSEVAETVVAEESLELTSMAVMFSICPNCYTKQGKEGREGSGYGKCGLELCN